MTKDARVRLYADLLAQGVPEDEAYDRADYKTADPARKKRLLNKHPLVVAARAKLARAEEPEWDLDDEDESEGSVDLGPVPEGKTPREFYEWVKNDPELDLKLRMEATKRLEQMDRRDNPADDTETVLAKLRDRVSEVQREHEARLRTNAGLAAELNALANATRPELAERIRGLGQWVLNEAPEE